MQRQGDIVRYTAEELQEMRQRGEDRTDWAKVDATTEEELEASIAADADDVHEEPDWSKAFQGIQPIGKQIDIPIDTDVLDWFKAAGKDYQTCINDVLRAHIEKQKNKEKQRRSS